MTSRCHSVRGGCHSVTSKWYSVPGWCHSVTGRWHSVTGRCHSITINLCIYQVYPVTRSIVCLLPTFHLICLADGTAAILRRHSKFCLRVWSLILSIIQLHQDVAEQMTQTPCPEIQAVGKADIHKMLWCICGLIRVTLWSVTLRPQCTRFYTSTQTTRTRGDNVLICSQQGKEQTGILYSASSEGNGPASL